MISDLNRLKRTFHAMNEDGFDTENFLKWGYFFVDKNKDNLMKVFEEIKSEDYTFESLSETDDNLWQLYLSKVEILTPEGLHDKNNFFNELVRKNNVHLYDGWDVERLS